GRAAGAGGTDVLVAAALAANAQRHPPPRGAPSRGAGLPGPVAGPRRRADPVRQRRDPAGPDHRRAVTGAPASMLDLEVIGAGPCGLAAGAAAKRAGPSAALFDTGG